MPFTVHCRKTGEYVRVPGAPQDYSANDLQGICYGHRTWSTEPKSTFQLDDRLKDQEFTVGEEAKDAVDVP